MALKITGKKSKEARSPLKERPLRHAGQSLQDEIEDLLYGEVLKYAVMVLMAVVMAAIEWWRWFHPSPPAPIAISIVAVGAMAYAAFRVHRLWPRLQPLKLGRDGERIVGQQLEELRSKGCHVFHDIPGEGFNLDHVLVSTRGIFSVETKTLSKPASGEGKVVFDGECIRIAGRTPDRDYLVQAAAQRRWLRDLLHEMTGQQFAVRSVIVFPGWFVLEEAFSPEVRVLNPKFLPGFLDREREVLRPSDVALINSRLAIHVRSRE